MDGEALRDRMWVPRFALDDGIVIVAVAILYRTVEFALELIFGHRVPFEFALAERVMLLVLLGAYALSLVIRVGFHVAYEYRRSQRLYRERLGENE